MTHEVTGNRGWAYCARTPDKELFMAYFEADCPRSLIRGAIRDADYAGQWFDPRTGVWVEFGTLHSDMDAQLRLPDPPTGGDWAVKLKMV